MNEIESNPIPEEHSKSGTRPPEVPAEPGSPKAARVTWLVLVILVSVMVLLQWKIVVLPLPRPPKPVRTASGGVMLLLGRYAVATGRLAPGAGPALLAEIDKKATTWEDRLRVAALAAEVGEGEASALALERLERLAEDELSEVARGDLELFRTIYRDGPDALTADQRSALLEAHGWFAELALSHGLDDDDPLRAPVLAKAQRLLAVGGLVALAAGCGFLVGLCMLLVVVPLRIARGQPRALYRAPNPGGSAYLETFTLFIAGMLAISFVSPLIAWATGFDPSRILVWLLLLIPLWPLRRGAERARWQRAIGWHRGRGLLREIAAGVVGYVAGLPIFAGGCLLTILLVFAMQQVRGDSATPSHPIIHEIGQGGVGTVVALYLLAAVWAPLTEETMFRGAFYHHLRGRLGPILSSLGVAFVFAIIHPQGVEAVPALMSLAVVFALIREWRGSIIASATAHALHNGTLVTALLFALG